MRRVTNDGTASAHGRTVPNRMDDAERPRWTYEEQHQDQREPGASTEQRRAAHGHRSERTRLPRRPQPDGPLGC